MNKCHTPIGWQNDTTPAINETNLNYMDGCIDTIDDRVVGFDTSKANQSDLLKAFKDVSLNTTTGVITFTLFDNTTKTIDTLLEKVAINFDYDDNPASAHYQNLIIALEDGTFKYIDMSALITEYEFTTSDTIAFTVDQDGAVSASVRDGSITGTKLQPNYLADVTAQASAASDAATASNANQLLSEGYANGTQGNIPVSSSSPYYHNNAKYWKEQAQAIAGQTLGGLTDVTITTPADGDVLAYNSTSQEWENSHELKDSIGYLYTMTGGKNLNSYPYYDTSKAASGVTWTDNGDGTVKVTTATQASATVGFYCHRRIQSNNQLILPNGTYILNGCPNGGSVNSYYIDIAITKNGSGLLIGQDTGNGVEFTINGDDNYADKAIVQIGLVVVSGTSLPASGITFKPMIRDASIADDTYVPYAMTNRELTERCFIPSNSNTNTVASGNFTDTTTYTVQSDGIYSCHVQCNTANSGNGLGIWKNSISDANQLALVRTHGQQYDCITCVVPLRGGTDIVFKCGASSISCTYRVVKLT